MSERRAFFGALALSGAQLVKLGLQFAVLPVLARILGPSDYGLVALAMPFILLANMVSDAGLGNALVRTPNPSRELESTVFWLSVLVCGALTLVIWVLAWPASSMLHEPRLPPILMALSSLLVVSGSLSVANARIMRERRFSVFAAGEICASAASAAAAIAAALAGFGPWSLVVQQLFLWTVKAVWVTTAARFRPALVCRPSLAGPHLSFGLHAAASNVTDFIGKNAPTVIVGAVLGVTEVGRYSLAFQLIRLPDSLISGPIYLAVFTAVARLGDDLPGAAALASRSLRGVASAVAPIFGGLLMVADLIVKLLLGPKWAGADAVLAQLAPAGFFICFYSIVSSVLMGLGHSKSQFRLTVLGALATGGAALIGSRFGLTGVATALSIAFFLLSPAYIGVLAGRLGLKPLDLASEIAPPLASTGVMMLAVGLVRSQVTHWSDVGQLAAAVAAGVAAFATALFVLSGRRLLADLRGVLPQGAPAAPKPWSPAGT
ncbi:MAG TPA: lipopolysaccharide biosynthesis protein [Caulobacteraceae bacterium]|jgi:PST family polysaccharide transporter